MSQFQKVKVAVNKTDFNLALATSEGRIEFYQSVIDQIKELIPDFTFNPNDLQLLFSNPKAYLVDNIIKEPTKIAGLDLCKNKVFELLADSDRLQIIVNNVDELKSNNSYSVDSSNISDFKRNLDVCSPDYEITEENVVIFKQAAKEKLEDLYSIYLKTEKQKTAYDSLQIILAEFNKLNSMYGRSHIKFIEENIVQNSHGEMKGIDYSNLHTLE